MQGFYYSFDPLFVTCYHSLAHFKIFSLLLDLRSLMYEGQTFFMIIFLASLLILLDMETSVFSQFAEVFGHYFLLVFFILQFQSQVCWSICYCFTNLWEPLNFFSKKFPLCFAVNFVWLCSFYWFIFNFTDSSVIFNLLFSQFVVFFILIIIFILYYTMWKCILLCYNIPFWTMDTFLYCSFISNMEFQVTYKSYFMMVIAVYEEEFA